MSTPQCVPASSLVSRSMQTMQHEPTLLYGSAISPPTSLIPLSEGRQGSNENHLCVPQKISLSPPVSPYVMPEMPLQSQSALSPRASLLTVRQVSVSPPAVTSNMRSARSTTPLQSGLSARGLVTFMTRRWPERDQPCQSKGHCFLKQRKY